MKMLQAAAALTIALGGWAGSASADPDKDESGKGRERAGLARSLDGVPGLGPEGSDSYWRPRPERQAFKEEYDDGRCKVERKVERSGEYKEETKCRGG